MRYFKCPDCERNLAVDDDALGKPITCKFCGHTFETRESQNETVLDDEEKQPK